MSPRMHRLAALGAALLALMLLPGCANKAPPSLYAWGPYESQVAAHFRGEDARAQLQLLEQHAQAAEAAHVALPPGYRAHMGMLYATLGRDTDFVAALEAEKRHFPESAPYMDSLLKKTLQGAPNAKP